MPCLILRGMQDLPSSPIVPDMLYYEKLSLFCFGFFLFGFFFSPKLAMFFVTEQFGKGALQRKAHPMSSYKAGKDSCCLVLIAGIPVTNVDYLNTDLGPWMFLFTETRILCSVFIRAFCTSLCSFFLPFVFREIGFVQKRQGCKKKVHSEV